MQAEFKWNNKKVTIDFAKPINLSIPIRTDAENPNAFFAPKPSFEPVKTEHFVGSTKEGGLVNFKNILINPHGNGTHTECVGHISKEDYYITECLQEHHFFCEVVSIEPEKINGDFIVTEKQLKSTLFKNDIEAVAIRTLPNNISKKTRNWSGTNPPYISEKAVNFLVERGINHLLVDFPSVDREEDEGKLLAHKAFWKYPSKKIRTYATITEMIFIDDTIKDGLYLLNIQIARFEMDASPSNISIYKVEEL